MSSLASNKCEEMRVNSLSYIHISFEPKIKSFKTLASVDRVETKDATPVASYSGLDNTEPILVGCPF